MEQETAETPKQLTNFGDSLSLNNLVGEKEIQRHMMTSQF